MSKKCSDKCVLLGSNDFCNMKAKLITNHNGVRHECEKCPYFKKENADEKNA